MQFWHFKYSRKREKNCIPEEMKQRWVKLLTT